LVEEPVSAVEESAEQLQQELKRAVDEGVKDEDGASHEEETADHQLVHDHDWDISSGQGEFHPPSSDSITNNCGA
jgi:hypothetical protein